MSLEKLGPDVSREGSRVEAPVEDNNVASLLNDLLKEMKILNLHMSVVTGNQFTRLDVE